MINPVEGLDMDGTLYPGPSKTDGRGMETVRCFTVGRGALRALMGAAAHDPVIASES
jgi:hypothetical protein